MFCFSIRKMLALTLTPESNLTKIKWRVSKFSFCNRAYLKYLSSLAENRGHKKMIVWLKLISSGLIDSLIQVSVLIFSSFFRPPWLGSFAEIAECFPRLRAQYDLEQAPWTGNQAAWHSLEVSRTLSPASHKFLCICKLLHHEFAGGTSGCFRQQMEEPYEFVKGGSGFRSALERAPDPWQFLFPCSLQDLVGRCNEPADATRSV